jgi:toxin CcdB
LKIGQRWRHAIKLPYADLDVQANLLSELNTCVVIPLASETLTKSEAAVRLKPVIQIASKNYILMTTDLAAISRKSLGKHIANLEEQHRQDIIESLDFLFQGF